MKERIKTKLEKDGTIFFGPGVEELFALIRETGSVRDASEKMGMSYSKAWKMIGICEECTGKKVVERTKGGDGGGGSARLTPAGEALLDAFTSFENDVQEYAHKVFGRHFEQVEP